jgi:hypothetical protein
MKREHTHAARMARRWFLPMQAEDEEHQKGMSRTGSAFQRATSGKLPPSNSQREPMPERRSASFKQADRTSVPPLAIAMLVCGTRGDVQPFLALALGLQKDGHRVRLATHAIFKDYVESYGVQFFPMGKWLPRLLRLSTCQPCNANDGCYMLA